MVVVGVNGGGGATKKVGINEHFGRSCMEGRLETFHSFRSDGGNSVSCHRMSECLTPTQPTMRGCHLCSKWPVSNPNSAQKRLDEANRENRQSPGSLSFHG